LNDVTRLYSIAQVAAQNMVLSSSLGSLDVMVSMAQALRNIPNENIVFIQYPVLDAPADYPGKVIPDPVLATEVMEKVQQDVLYTLAENSAGRGSISAPDAEENVEIAEPAPEETAPADPEPDTTPAPSDENAESDIPPADAASDEEPVTEEPVTQAEVLEGLVGQTADDVTCAVAN